MPAEKQKKPLEGNRVFACILILLPLLGPLAMLQDPTLGTWSLALLVPFVVAANALAAFNLVSEHGSKSLWLMFFPLIAQGVLWWFYVRSL